MVEAVCFLILLLNTTGLFRFIAPIFGVPIGAVSIALLVILGIYIIYHNKLIITTISPWLPWLGIILIWPLLSMIYAPEIDIRQIGLLVYMFFLFVCSAIFARVNGLAMVHLLFGISLGITIVGEVLNFTHPALFEPAAVLADARVLQGFRPGGFFLQPNSLGIGLVTIFLGWLTSANRETIVQAPLIYLVFVISLLFTGSRTALILGLLILLIHASSQWFTHLFRSKRIKNIEYRLLVIVIILIVGIVSITLVLRSSQLETQDHIMYFVDRIASLFQFRYSNLRQLFLEDKSIVQRTALQREYWQWIIKRPLFGYGLGAESYQIGQGEFKLTSHSTLISQGFDFGIFYPLVLMGLIFSLYQNHNRKEVERYLSANIIFQFLIISILLYIGSGDLFRRREYLIVLGMVFALVNFSGEMRSSKENEHGEDSIEVGNMRSV